MSDAKQLLRILPHSYQGRFNNYRNEASGDALWHSVLMYIQSLLARRHDTPDIIQQWCQPTAFVNASDHRRIFWLGHSTFLIQVGGKNILTDPVFGNLTLLFRRITPAGITLEQLPSIDYVLISHNHRDHMDSPSLIALKKRFPLLRLLVPQGDKDWFDRRGFTQVSEHMWWNRVELPGVTCTFLPAFHWSQRGLFDRNKSLWGSWMIESDGFCLYFAGDTAYADHFSRIAHYFPAIDAALMPIGPCQPRAWMKRSHVDADEAGQAFLDLQAHHFVPMHWGTFYFGTDGFLAPIEHLTAWWQRHTPQVTTKKLTLLKIGQFALLLPSITPTAHDEVGSEHRLK